MAAAIYWMPTGAEAMRFSVLSRALEDLHDYPGRARMVHRTAGGRRKQVRRRSALRLHVKYTTQSADEFDELDAITNHLDRGGRIQLLEDSTKSFAAFAVEGPEAGGSGLVHHGALWGYGGAALEGGDRVILSGPSPRYLMERLTLASAPGTAVFWTPTNRFAWDTSPWVLIRHSGFYPALRRPLEDQSDPWQHEGRKVWTWDIHLEEDVDFLAGLAAAPDEPLLDDVEDPGRRTLEDGSDPSRNLGLGLGLRGFG